MNKYGVYSGDYRIGIVFAMNIGVATRKAVKQWKITEISLRTLKQNV